MIPTPLNYTWPYSGRIGMQRWNVLRPFHMKPVPGLVVRKVMASYVGDYYRYMLQLSSVLQNVLSRVCYLPLHKEPNVRTIRVCCPYTWHSVMEPMRRLSIHYSWPTPRVWIFRIVRDVHPWYWHNSLHMPTRMYGSERWNAARRTMLWQVLPRFQHPWEASSPRWVLQ